MAGRAMSPIERAEAKIKDMQGGGEEEATTEEETPAEQEAPTEAKPEDQESGSEVAEEKKPEPQKPSEKPAEKKDDEKDWQAEYKRIHQKYRSLDGMLNPLKEQVDALKEQNKLLMERLNSNSGRGEEDGNTLPSGASKQQIAQHAQTLLDDYGEEFVDVMRSFIKAEADDLFSKRIEPVNKRVEQGETNQEELRRAGFKANLSSRVPDWEEIYHSEEFDEWLNANTERMTGKSYADIFTEANNKWNLAAVANFFETFKEATGKAESEQQQAPDSDPRERLVAPGDSNASVNTPTAGKKKIWTLREVNQFYKDAQTGKYVGREDEMARIDQEIFQANLEDRIKR
jgi:hypothetical protein